MKSFLQRGAIASALAMACAAGMAQEALPADALVQGISQSKWSEHWWQWAGSFDVAHSPVSDQTGEFCGLKQKGPVWFLAGTYGTRRTVRTCKVPKDTYLFFPLINYVVMQHHDTPGACMSATLTAARITNEVSGLLLDLNGKRTDNMAAHRQATGCFNVGSLATPPATIYPSAANGYYVMLNPLPPGKHQLNFGGVLPSMQQAVTYTLIVE